MRAGTMALGGALALAAAALGGRAFATQATIGAAPRSALTAEAPVDVATCTACHGANGVSRSPRIPNLAGQQPDYLVAQLHAFKSGTRKNDLMEAIAAQLSDTEMSALARYWSSQPAGGGADAHMVAAGPAIPSRMAFPGDFPTGFTLYQTVDTNGAIAERYANAPAVAAARAGRPLPEGSVILVVNRPAAGAPPSGYAAMETRAGWGAAIPTLLRNGNWDYAVFDARRVRNARLNQAQCLACHRPQAGNSYVFTLAELRTAAAGAGH
jgi:cytochrome c553